MIVVRYKNVIKSIPRLFVCFAHCSVAVPSMQAQNEIQTVCIDNSPALQVSQKREDPLLGFYTLCLNFLLLC